MRYPFGYFSFILIFVLVGARNFLAIAPLKDWIFYGILCAIFLKCNRICIFSKKFLACFFISGMVATYIIYTSRIIPKHGQFEHGTFQFEKLFRTQPNRIGGTGLLMLPDGRTRHLYLHAPLKSPIVLNDDCTYHFSGYVKPLRNPFLSSKNFSFYLWSRWVRYHAEKIKLSAYDPQLPLSRLQTCRHSLFSALTTSDEITSHVYRAILMGKKEGLSKDQLQHFFYTGTIHLFAVSGLHVGVVSMFFFFLCRILFFPIWLRLIITGSGVLLYASIVGFSPSTLRATLMVAFILLAQLFSRPIDSRNAFFNTIGLTLIFNPFELWDVGFQLSYGTVASILCIGLPLSQWYKQKRPNAPNWQLTCIVSFCASTMSSLFSIYYWHLFTPWAFVANLLLIPLASLIVILGMTSWGIYLVCPILLPIFEFTSRNCILLLLKSVIYLEKFPGAICNASMRPYSFCLCLFLVAILIIFFEKCLALKKIF